MKGPLSSTEHKPGPLRAGVEGRLGAALAAAAATQHGVPAGSDAGAAAGVSGGEAKSLAFLGRSSSLAGPGSLATCTLGLVVTGSNVRFPQW